MSLFDSELTDSIGDFMAGLGDNVYINGIPVQAIFADELFDEEQGTFRKTTLSIKKQDLPFFKKGDSIVVRDRSFIITYIPDTHDTLIDLELKDA